MDKCRISFGTMIIASILCSTFFMRKEERYDYLNEKKEKVSSILPTYISILKMKPARILGATIFLWAGIGAMSSGISMYFSEGILGYSAETRATLGSIQSLMPLAWLPVINYLAQKFDKRSFYGFAMIFSGSVGVFFRIFIGFPETPWIFLLTALLNSFGNTTFWTVAFSLMYDIGELDEFLSGKNRIGSISAIISVIQKFGAALGLFMVGVFLEIGGYDATVAQQTEKAAYMILNVSSIIPGSIGMMTGALAFLYPLTRKRFAALQDANAKKKQDAAMARVCG